MAGSVYILGAGASRADTLHLALPMPLATNFFAPAYLSEHWPKDDEGDFSASPLHTILSHYFGFTAPTSPAINVEEVYSFLDISLNVYPSLALRRPFLEQARRQLLLYIVSVVRYVPWKLELAGLHLGIVEHLGQYDSVVTFNWDLIIDWLLHATKKDDYLARQATMLDPLLRRPLKDAENESLDDYHQGHLIKLHGSINFGVCTNSSCRRHESPYRFGLLEEGLDWSHCIECGGALETLLVPPHVNKTYSRSRFLRLQARLAAGHISAADELIVVGYSFPPADFEAETMFRLARLEPQVSPKHMSWLKRLVLVNPAVRSRRYIQRVKRILGIRGNRLHGTKIDIDLYPDATEFMRARGWRVA